MSVVGVNATTQTYATYGSTAAKTEKRAEEKKNDTAASQGAVYEQSSSDNSKKPYSVNKMSSEERASLVEQLKADQEARQSQLLDLVNKTISKQGKAFAQANDDFWKFLAKGDFTVDAETKAQAQKDIAEDGYWGVEKTAQRIFDFASALAGDDVDQMKKMQAAFEKGYKQATKSWGKELPDISSQTHNRVNEMFDAYYSSKDTFTEE